MLEDQSAHSIQILIFTYSPYSFVHRDFATELTKFSATFVPEMLALMRANKVEGAEKVLLAEISAKIIQLDDQQDSSKLD